MIYELGKNEFTQNVIVNQKNLYLGQQLFTKEPSSNTQLFFFHVLVLFLCTGEHTLHKPCVLTLLNCLFLLFIFVLFLCLVCAFHIFLGCTFSQRGSVVYINVHLNKECRTLNIIRRLRPSSLAANGVELAAGKILTKFIARLTAEIEIFFFTRLIFGARAFSARKIFVVAFHANIKHRRTTSLCRRIIRRDPSRRLSPGSSASRKWSQHTLAI